MKQRIKALLLKILNVMPVSSSVFGSPRKAMISRTFATVFRASAQYQIMLPSVPVRETVPGTIDKEIFFKYTPLFERVQPEQFVLTLTNARVWGNKGAVVGEHDVFLTDVSMEFGQAKFNPFKHSIFNRLKIKKSVLFDGSAAVVASPGTDVYAHWFCDVLPRIMLLKENNLLDKVDKILLNYKGYDFQIESLRRLQVPDDKILNCISDTEFHMKVKTLYVPSYPNSHGTVNQWVCKKVQELFSDIVPDNKKERLYISRSRAVGRRVLNEDVLFEYLAAAFGFKMVYAEDYEMPEKIRLFRSAEFIVAPHGGGLTNIIFCRPECKVIDIFPPGDFDTFFWSMANANDLKYYYFFGEGEMPTGQNDFAVRNEDITVNLDKFKTLMADVAL